MDNTEFSHARFPRLATLRSPRGRRLPPASRLVDEDRLAGPIVAHLAAAPAAAAAVAAEAADATEDRGAHRDQDERHPETRHFALRPVPLTGRDGVSGGERAEIVDEAHVGTELHARRPEARAHHAASSHRCRPALGAHHGAA
eukprot:scaffold22335_cov71-Phaeocystis_antarctica.AAC.3